MLRYLVVYGLAAAVFVFGGTSETKAFFVCDYSPRVQVGTIHADAAPFLNEASGLVQSRRTPAVFWSHNDNGGDERLFALRRDGTYLGTYHLSGGLATRDIEDIALGPGPSAGVDYLYLGDVGANWRIWGCTTLGSTTGACSGCVLPNDCRERDLQVLRAPEPAVDPGQVFVTVSGVPATTFTFRFPDTVMLGRRQDVETMMVDPATRDLYFVTKRTTPAMVFRAAYPYSSAQLSWVANLPWGGDNQATGGDISADGGLVIIRRYGDAFVWERPAGTTVDFALGGTPCHRTNLADAQGEAVALAVDGSGSFYTTSEGSGSVPIWFHQTTPLTCGTNSECDDGLFCNGGEICNGQAGCQPGVAPSCANQRCSETLDRCVNCLTATDCPPSMSCDESGTCALDDALPIRAGDLWRFQPGSTTAPAGWTTTGFDDGGWSVGPGGFGYGSDCSSMHGTMLTGMPNNYLTLYLRHSFHVSDPSVIPGLRLVVDYDDGFAAYINGVEVARDNLPAGMLNPTVPATTNHECSASPADGRPPRVYFLSPSLLVSGLNVLAIEGHNVTTGSSDFSLVPSLEIASNSDPGLEVSLSVSQSGSTTNLTLSSSSVGVVYDLASGSISELAADRDTSAAQCLMSQSSSGQYSDTRPEPVAGAGYFYLARARDDEQTGSWGNASSGAMRNVPDCP